MARMSTPKKLASFAPGVNNRLAPTQLDTVGENRTSATYLVRADNVDLSAEGRARRRRGTTLSLAGRAHSLWGDERGQCAVLDGNLVSLALSGSTLTPTTIRPGMSGRPVSYSRGADGEVYWSDQIDIRRISAGVDRPVTTPSLAREPDVTVVQGALRAGQYMLAFTAMSQDGESGSTTPMFVDVPDGGGLLISALPGTPTRVYVSGPNGEVPTLQFVTSATDATVAVHRADGIRCQTLLNSPMPAGQIVRHFLGRMLVASGSILFISEPYNYGIYDGASGYIPFPEPITVVEPTSGGVYVVADMTYFFPTLSGGPEVALAYGALAGSGGYDRRTKTAYWMSVKGLVVADPDGRAKNIQEHALTFGGASRAATLYREADGMRHLLTTCADVRPDETSSLSGRVRQAMKKGT